MALAKGELREGEFVEYTQWGTYADFQGEDANERDVVLTAPKGHIVLVCEEQESHVDIVYDYSRWMFGRKIRTFSQGAYKLEKRGIEKEKQSKWALVHTLWKMDEKTLGDKLCGYWGIDV